MIKCALAAFLGGLLLLITPEMGAAWNGVGLIVVGGLCLVLLNGKYWPQAFARRAPRGSGPRFEVGDPHDPSTAAPPTPLIQAMHRVRGKRPPSPD